MNRTAEELAARIGRESYGRLIAYLAARDRDVPAAEDALSDAFAAALQSWPAQGAPADPEGWLIVAAEQALRLVAEELAEAEPHALPDRRLALMFACAHPAIEAHVRAPLRCRPSSVSTRRRQPPPLLSRPPRWVSGSPAPRRG